MNRYFIGYEEITEAEANEILKKDNELLEKAMETGDVGLLKDAYFVTVIKG